MTGGQIARAGSSQSWVNGRKGAMIVLNSAGASQYMPIWSCKSQAGSWDCGTYTENRLHFSYITDTNYKRMEPTPKLQTFISIPMELLPLV